jgi:hypothetical protein
MAFTRRICRICGHDTQLMTACGMGKDRCDGTEARPWLPVRDDLHDHCREGCCCTVGGCRAQRVDLKTGEPV